jgi:hypothetical protein
MVKQWNSEPFEGMRPSEVPENSPAANRRRIALGVVENLNKDGTPKKRMNSEQRERGQSTRKKKGVAKPDWGRLSKSERDRRRGS